MTLINVSLIESCNFNLIDFLKVRNFYFDLVLLTGESPWPTKNLLIPLLHLEKFSPSRLFIPPTPPPKINSPGQMTIFML